MDKYFNDFEKALDIWGMTKRAKHVITCSQKYGSLARITKWFMDNDIPYYVDDSNVSLDDEAGYKIHMSISEVELAGLDEYTHSINGGAFVYVE